MEFDHFHYNTEAPPKEPEPVRPPVQYSHFGVMDLGRTELENIKEESGLGSDRDSLPDSPLLEDEPEWVCMLGQDIDLHSF